MHRSAPQGHRVVADPQRRSRQEILVAREIYDRHVPEHVGEQHAPLVHAAFDDYAGRMPEVEEVLD